MSLVSGDDGAGACESGCGCDYDDVDCVPFHGDGLAHVAAL